MLSFKEFLNEGRRTYPGWVRVTVFGIVVKIRSLQKQIESESDPTKQNKLLSQQNTLISYITGLGIGVGTNDKQLITKMRSGLGGRSK